VLVTSASWRDPLVGSASRRDPLVGSDAHRSIIQFFSRARQACPSDSSLRRDPPVRSVFLGGTRLSRPSFDLGSSIPFRRGLKSRAESGAKAPHSILGTGHDKRAPGRLIGRRGGRSSNGRRFHLGREIPISHAVTNQRRPLPLSPYSCDGVPPCGDWASFCRSNSHKASRDWGMTFTFARTGMKLVSPFQRGTTCQ